MRLTLIFAFCFLIQPRAFAADATIVAPGSSMVGYLLKLQPDLEKRGMKMALLRKDGLSGDSVLLAVATGKAELGFLGNNWDDVIKLITDSKTVVPNREMLVHQTVGVDKVVFITSPGGVKELTNEQLGSIFTGKVQNWKQVGGPDSAIQIVLPSHSLGAQKFISNKLLAGEDFFRKGSKNFSSYSEILDFLGSTKGSISFCPGETETTGVQVLRHKELARDIVAVTLGPPQPSARKIIDYFKAHVPQH